MNENRQRQEGQEGLLDEEERQESQGKPGVFVSGEFEREAQVVAVTQETGMRKSQMAEETFDAREPGGAGLLQRREGRERASQVVE